MKLENYKMDRYLQALDSISTKVSGKLAYAVARNIRKMSDELVEYRELKDKAIREYGEAGEDGKSSIMVGTEAYYKFEAEMKQYTNIAHEVSIYMISEEDLLSSSLNANEILSIDFMIKEDDTETTDE